MLKPKNKRVLPILSSLAVIILSSICFFIIYQSGISIFTSSQINQLDIVSPQTFNLKVLTIGINPQENSEKLVPKYFEREASTIEAQSFNWAIDAFARLSNNKIRYTIVQHLEITEFPKLPDNSPVFDMAGYDRCRNQDDPSDAVYCDERKWAFSYKKFFEDFGICTLANQYNVDEIWMMTPPYIGKWESLFIGPTLGYTINGVSEISATCNKLYPVMGPTYDRPETLLHNFSHRFEGNIEYILTNVKSEEKINNWQKFSGFASQQIGCGNGHKPKNFRFDYDYGNPATADFTCADWSNFPNYTNAKVNIGCSAWGCNDAGWQEYWFSSIPNRDGNATLKNNRDADVPILRNWWNYLLKPSESIAFFAQSRDLEPTIVATATVTITTSPTVPATTTAPLTCTSFTYSNWASCLNGNQNRTVITALPNNCSGGNPIIIQSCTISTVIPTTTVSVTPTNSGPPVVIIPTTITTTTVPSTTPTIIPTATVSACLEYTYSEWNACKNGKQQRQLITASPLNCVQDTGSMVLEKSCSNNTLYCTDIEYDWSPCENNTQQRIIKSKSPISCIANETAVSRSCNLQNSTVIPGNTTEELPNIENPNKGIILTGVAIIGILGLTTLAYNVRLLILRK